jgi:MFS family permease
MDEAARGARFGALTYRNFRLFFLGQGVSLIGTWMQNVAQGWLVLDLTNSPFYVGLVSALGSLGVLLLTIYAGVIVDRTNKHRLIIATQSLSMIPAFALATLVWSRSIAVWQVAALAAFLGVVNAFDIPARQAFMVELVGRDELVSAIALNSSAFNAARVVGPAVAGVLIGVLGVGACFFLNGVSYLAVIGGLLAMRLPPYVPASGTASLWAGLREIVAFIRSDRRVATVVALMGVLSICGFPYLVMMPVFARDVLHRGAAGYGVMMTSVGLGALIGALAVALFDRRIRKGPTLVAAGAAFSALLVAFALSRSYLLSVALLALTGGTMIVNNALANATIQTIVPDHLRGRVMGFYAFVFVGLAPIGSFTVGTLAERVGTPVAVAAGGALSAVAVVLSAAWVPELTRTE